MRVRIRHQTRYRYAEPVLLGPHQIRLRPAEHTRAKVLSYNLAFSPKAEIRWQQDPWGNRVARLTFPAGAEAEELALVVDAAFEIRPVNPFDFFVDDRCREVPFVYPLPEAADAGRLVPPPGASLRVERGFVRGSIDLVLRHEGKGWLFDWKTNSLDSFEPASLRAAVDEAYALQGRIYALALAKMLRLDGPAACEARLGGVAFLFLRGLEAPSPGWTSTEAGLVVLRPTWDDLAAWSEELATLDPALLEPGAWGGA